MTSAQRYAVTIVRVTLGVIFFAHGAQKVLGWFGAPGWNGTIEAFAKQGMRAPMTVLVMIAEFFGVLGVLVDCLTRIAAFGPAIVMTGAIFLVHLKNGFFLNWFVVPGKGHGIECNLAYLAMAVALMLAGPGALSIDELLFGRDAEPR